MKPITTTRSIEAPVELVFRMVSDVRRFREAVPHITDVEFLTETQHGVGTRFRETRLMKGREQSCVLEVTQFVENDRVRMVTDEGGTIWDTLFTVSGADEKTELSMHMDAKPHTLFARLITPLIRSMVVQGVESDMDAIKTYCESPSR